MAAEAEAGRQPGVALLQERAVPAEFAQAYRAGERSGRLDESLGWLARRYEEEAERKLGLVALWYPQFALLGVAVWVVVFYATRFVSLASILLAASLPVSSWLLHQTRFLSLFFCILGVFIILRHRSNIQRLLAGTESKFAKKKPDADAGR